MKWVTPILKKFRFLSFEIHFMVSAVCEIGMTDLFLTYIEIIALFPFMKKKLKLLPKCCVFKACQYRTDGYPLEKLKNTQFKVQSLLNLENLKINNEQANLKKKYLPGAMVEYNWATSQEKLSSRFATS